MMPALKYMVMTTKRYQKRLPHILRLVNKKPRKAEPRTVQTVPMAVLPTDTSAACGSPFRLRT
ncbi:hypothetical protein D3C81_2170010 [compost metagenome]